MSKSTFIHDDFLLDSEASQELYHQHAAHQPILDYHCHLSPQDLAENRSFNNLTEIWLEGDHYKWRAMRANGVAEEYCTGQADPYEKFLAYAETVPATLRNPLYHWTHLELKRYFGIDTLLSKETAPEIWAEANRQLQSPTKSTWGIVDQFNVQLIGTTDDPTDDLLFHDQIASGDCPGKVVPTFRPDPAFLSDQVQHWNRWVDRLGHSSDLDCQTLNDFLSALEKRIHFFKDRGCRASDHGLQRCPESILSETKSQEVFSQVRNGGSLSKEEADGFNGFLLCWLGEQYAKVDWAMQLHLGPIRNVNQHLFDQLGTDIGCDSIGDDRQIPGLQCILGELSKRNKLPKTILYNLNPTHNYPVAAMCGNFSQEGFAGKMQFGSGWWFLDQLEGMTWQINTLSNLGLLRHFIGMLTDSRSFMSFPRHEYFRRLLCHLLGNDIERGLVPHDMSLLAPIVEGVCYRNAARFLDADA
ncbi:MAG: glucuronate isomerase [Verrucomicrobiota bacterium]